MKKGFDFMGEIGRPLATGVAIYIVLNVIAWILSAFGFAPFLGGASLNVTAPGIVGLVVIMWALGKLALLMPELVKNFTKNL